MRTNVRIVFPEAENVRILSAAARLIVDDMITPILIGDADVICNLAKENDLNIDEAAIINPKTSPSLEYYAEKFIECREGKCTLDEAKTMVENVNYFGAMMVYLNEADGMVSGATGPSSDTIRPALQIIKTQEGVNRVSGAMLMISPNGKKYILADVAVNPRLKARDLAEVALQSAITAEMFGISPRVAMLSFSTNGSAKTPESKKIALAVKIAKKMAPKLNIDGEMQFDTAFVKSIGSYKMPNSSVAGRANVFIFPDLQSGNIAYKIIQYIGGYRAFGPLLQGLNKPVNDLSRGCTEDDIYNIAIITATQSIRQHNIHPIITSGL